MKNKYYFEDIADAFCFGVHENDLLCDVIKEDPKYIYWCVNNIEDFFISEMCLQQIREIFPNFIIPQNFEAHICKKEDFYNYEEEYEAPYDEAPTYERYGGSYAQDEMGYSDDDIDTIFDGDPSAYWNID